MAWFIISTIAYFLIALEVVLDKFLITSKRVAHPAIYAFYSGILSLFTLAFLPFGFHYLELSKIFFYIFPGFIFAYAILLLFFAIRKSEASRVTSVTGAIIPLATYFFSLYLLPEKIGPLELGAVILLIFGGLLISWKPNGEKGKKIFFAGFYPAIASGIVLALSFTIFKKLYLSDNFINVFIWTRMGFVLGSISLLAFPFWRKIIFKSLRNFKKPKKENKRSGLLFVFNKILGGAGSILLNFAVYLGNVTIVNALVSLEYVFIFVMGLIFSCWHFHIFQESREARIIIQKIVAIAIISAGLFLIFI